MNCLNKCYFVAVISEINEEYILSSGIQRPIIKAKCFDSDDNISEIMLVFSNVNQIKRAGSLKIGDVINFSAKISECPKDNYIFYPENIFQIKKCVVKFEQPTDRLIETRLVQFKTESNIVLFSGQYKCKSKNKVCIVIDNDNYTRGDTHEEYHIWVTATNDIDNIKGFVSFVGEVKGTDIVGQVFEVKRKKEK